MKNSITITIHPCKSPVTITIQGGDITTTRQTKPPKEGQAVDLDDYWIERIKDILNAGGGFSTASEISKTLWRSNMRGAILERIEAVRKTVRKPGSRKPTTFYILPDRMEKFEKFVKKAGWTVCK